MQHLSPEAIEQAADLKQESIPALMDTEYYFALVNYNGRKILCILDGAKWRPTTYEEMMRLMR